MTQFYQQGQQVQRQYNAGRDMNFVSVQTPEELGTALEQLNYELGNAKDAGALPEETATDAQYQVTKAVQQAKKPNPDKKSITDYLTTAKTLIESLSATSGLVSAVAAAIEAVHKLF